MGGRVSPATPHCVIPADSFSRQPGAACHVFSPVPIYYELSFQRSDRAWGFAGWVVVQFHEAAVLPTGGTPYWPIQPVRILLTGHL